jgi:sugar phosphate permease
MSLTAASTKELLDSPVLKSAISKASFRLMPMLVILYIVAFLDRTNVGFAEAALGVDRGVTAGAYALGAGIFFIGYALFEIPSNLLLTKFGAKVWLARIAITWGIVSACFAFVQGETSFIILRFLLGVTEAGLFPGVIMFLAAWFPNKVRVKMFAIFYLAQPFSQMMGAPLSGWLINIGDQVPGVAGWQVMFFVEGMLAVVAGIAAYFFLINSPQDAKFLNPGEKQALLDVMALEETVKEETGPRGVVAAMKNRKVWYFTAIYFCLQVAVYGVTFYLPQQVSQLTGQKVGLMVGLLAAIPWFFGIFACYFIGRAANTIVRRRVWGTGLFLSTGLCIFGSAWAGANHIPALGILYIPLGVCSFLSIAPSPGPTPRPSSLERQPPRALA